MLNNNSDKISKIGNIIRRRGKEGLKTLIIFKLIKSSLTEKIEEEYSKNKEIDENELNDLCMTKAKELISQGKENPSEDDIKQLISKIFSNDN